MERTRIQGILAESRLGQTGAVTAETVQRIGRLVGADTVVVGSIVLIGGDQMEVEARAVDVETGRLLAAAHMRAAVLRRGTAPMPPALPLAPLPVRAQAGTDLGPGSRLPWPAAVHGAAAMGGRLFASVEVVGSQEAAQIISAPILSGGRLGRWRRESPLPEGRTQAAMAAWGRRVYVIGGYHGSPRREVAFSEADAEGRLGTWRQAGWLPRGCTSGTGIAHRGVLHVTGCADSGGSVGAVFSAPILSSGALGEWISTSLLDRAAGGGAAVVSDRLVLIGGVDDAGVIRAGVVSVPLGADGMPATVRREPDFPVAVEGTALAAASGRLWSAGGAVGKTNSDFVNSVRSAPVTASGGIGAWVEEPTVLYPGRKSFVMPGDADRLFLLGGWTPKGNIDEIVSVPTGGLR